ncbi:xanthine dehydrogenase family protein molybdopterin-binding subunit, partial [Methylobacterium sp. WL116]
MKFDQPAGQNPIDQLKVVGKPTDRVEGPLKVTGTAPYAYEWHDPHANLAYGFIVGAGIAKGRIATLDVARAKAASGVVAVVTHENAGPLGQGEFYVHRFLAALVVDHYHQAVAVVVAETFEQARAAAALVRVTYVEEPGAFDLAAQEATAPVAEQGPFGGKPET